MQLPIELPSGIVSMGVRTYVPTLGRFLQPDPIPGGSANAYAYTFGDPIDTPELMESLRENTTVCKVVGCAASAGSFYIPATRFGRALGLVVGFGTTYAC